MTLIKKEINKPDKVWHVSIRTVDSTKSRKNGHKSDTNYTHSPNALFNGKYSWNTLKNEKVRNSEILASSNKSLDQLIAILLTSQD